MKLPFHFGSGVPISRRLVIAGPVGVLLVAATIAAFPSGAASFRSTIESSSIATPQDNPGGRPDPTVVIHATPAGFNPLEITVRPGPKRLIILNGSGLPNANFTVTRDDRIPVLMGRIGRGQRLSSRLVLVPGDLIVSEGTHPRWRCVIHVVP